MLETNTAIEKRLAFLNSKVDNGESLTEDQVTEKKELESSVNDASLQSEVIEKAINKGIEDALRKAEQPSAPIHGVKEAPQVMSKVSKDTYSTHDYVKALYNKDYSFLNEMVSKATMNVTTNSQGGYTVPEQLLGDVLSIVDDRGIAASKVTRYNMTSNKLDIPTKAGGVTWYKVSENAAGTESDPTFGNVQLDATDYLMAITRSGMQLLKDNAVNLENFLTKEFGYGLATFLDKEILAGDGTNFTGVLNESGTNVITMGSGDTAITNLALGDLNDMIDSLTTGESRGAAFYFNKAVSSVLAELADSQSRPLFTVGEDTLKYRGYPIYYVDNDILPNAPAVSTKFGILGNLENVAFGVREDDTDLQVSDSVTVGGQSTFERNQVAYKMLMRGAIKTTFPGAFSVVRTAAA